MNIKITKSSYKTKENKRAIIYDCSAKNYRKKINTGVFVEEEEFENPETSISLNITLKKLRNKKKDALIKYYENNWSTSELEIYLNKGIDIYSVEEYVKTDFIKNKSLITANDYLNVVKVFKKHLKKANIHFNDILDENTMFEFKYTAEKKGLKTSSINSYIKKMAVIMNRAHKDNLINKKFVIPRLMIEKRQKSESPKFNHYIFFALIVLDVFFLYNLIQYIRFGLDTHFHHHHPQIKITLLTTKFFSTLYNQIPEKKLNTLLVRMCEKLIDSY